MGNEEFAQNHITRLDFASLCMSHLTDIILAKKLFLQTSPEEIAVQLDDTDDASRFSLVQKGSLQKPN